MKENMTEQYLMIHILNNISDEYNIDLDKMEVRLCLPDTNINKLTMNDIGDKLSERW